MEYSFEMIDNENYDSSDFSTSEDITLLNDAKALHKALSELVRVYQFRDRKNIYYYDVSVTQCHALGVLIKQSPITLNKLAKGLYLDKSTTSRVIDSLEKKGYVKRITDLKDARAKILEVTQKGRNLHIQIENDLINEVKQLIDDLDPDIRQVTISLISRLTKSATIRFSQLKKKEFKE